MKMMRAGKTNGFSLVEILVAIGILAVLMLLLVPGLNSARESAKTAVSLSNLKQLATAMQQFISDNNGLLPRADGTDSDPGLDWAQALRPYGASHRMPVPNDAQNPIMINPAGVSDEYPPGSVRSSYCMNGNLQVNTPPAQGETIAPIFPIALVTITMPAQTVLFGDSKYAGRAMNFSHLAYRNNNNTTATVVFVDGHAAAVRPGMLTYEHNFANPPLN